MYFYINLVLINYSIENWNLFSIHIILDISETELYHNIGDLNAYLKFYPKIL